MRLTKQQFKEFILSEVKKMATAEGWPIGEEQPVKNGESGSVQEKPDAVNESAAEKPATTVAPEIQREEPKAEIEEVKKLTEEFRRMKELIDFRSPLLKKD